MKLSKAEQKVILDLRKKEEADKPKKTAIAKTNIYTNSNGGSSLENWFFNPLDKEKAIKQFANDFTLDIKKGDSFSCFIDDDQEGWYDDVGGYFEGMDTNWAKKYLTNIRDIK